MSEKIINFTYERDTKNKFRFKEQVDNGADEHIGALYVAKSAFPDGHPQKLQVTIKAA